MEWNIIWNVINRLYEIWEWVILRHSNAAFSLNPTFAKANDYSFKGVLIRGTCTFAFITSLGMICTVFSYVHTPTLLFVLQWIGWIYTLFVTRVECPYLLQHCFKILTEGMKKWGAPFRCYSSWGWFTNLTIKYHRFTVHWSLFQRSGSKCIWEAEQSRGTGNGDRGGLR